MKMYCNLTPSYDETSPKLQPCVGTLVQKGHILHESENDDIYGGSKKDPSSYDDTFPSYCYTFLIALNYYTNTSN